MNRTKLRALIHYIIAKSEPARLGAVRLNKILWYVDALTYRATGASVTGETYVKRAQGPVSSHVLSVLGDLEHADAIVVRERDRFGHSMKEYIARAEPDVSSLSQQELALVENLRSHICDAHTANSISELSHDKVWEAANIGEEIPLSATLVSASGEFTPDLAKWADSVVGRYEAIERAA